MQVFLNANQSYPRLKGVQTNMYKCFLPQFWMVGSAKVVLGLIYQEGIHIDANGGLAVVPR